MPDHNTKNTEHMYARREKTTDSTTLSMLKGRTQSNLRDVQLYSDQACTKPLARWGWWMSSKPRFGQRSTFLNCHRVNLTWVAPID